MNYKVSIIVPTYKRANMIERTLKSILMQSYENIEIVIVDDNKHDSEQRIKTEKIIKKYIKSDKVVYIKNRHNLGGAKSRNEGIKKSTGDYITFLDDDDIYLPDKISLQLNEMIKKHSDLSFTNVQFNNNKNKKIQQKIHDYAINLSNKNLLVCHLKYHLTPTSTYMFKRDSLFMINLFDDVEMGQEFFLMLKAIEAGLKIHYLNQNQVIQYIHGGERISEGKTKILKEKELYKFKLQRYGDILSLSDKRYLKFRHYAVLGIVNLRSLSKVRFIGYGLILVLLFPDLLISELLKNYKQ